MHARDVEKVLRIDHRNPTECRLCALLIFKLYSSETSLEIEYILPSRYGYFIDVDDIMFRPVGSTSSNTNVVRLGLQKAKLDSISNFDLFTLIYS
jgi:hypothetical protein